MGSAGPAEQSRERAQARHPMGTKLTGRACRPREQAKEEGASLGVGAKLRHVGDVPGQGHDGGPGPKQGRKLTCRLPAGRVVVEGQEDAGVTPEG